MQSVQDALTVTHRKTAERLARTLKGIASQLGKAIAEGDAGKGRQLVEAAATRLAQAITSVEACMKEHAAKF